MASLYQYLTLSCLLISLQTIGAKFSGGRGGRFGGHSFRGHGDYRSHVSAHHAYYTYHPPSHIQFMCRYCTHKTLYPVYHSTPPTYVTKFRESNSRFSVLLAGLSLYNLGRCCGHHSSHGSSYTVRQDEQCSLQVFDKHSFEETRFPCFMMSSFMEKSNQTSESNLFAASTEVPISVDISSANIDVKPYLSSNESELVLTNDHECVIWHNATFSNKRHNVPCVLLEKYADTMKASGVPVYIWMPILLSVITGIYVCCYCCCKKKKDKKEDMPINQNAVYKYCSNEY